MKHVPKALIRDGDRILVIRRASFSRNFPKYWDLPGGKPKLGESPEQALVRETKEETGLDIVVGECVGTYRGVGKGEFEFTVFAAEATGEIRLSMEHTVFKWVSEKELCSLTLMPFMVLMLDDLK